MLAMVLKAIPDIKSEMGAIRESIKTLSAGQNGPTPAGSNHQKTQQESGMAVKALAAAVVHMNQGKPARQVQVAKKLPTVMDSSWSQDSEEEVIYAKLRHLGVPATTPTSGLFLRP